MEEIKAFSLLQHQMEKRMEELQKLRLNLLSPASEVDRAAEDEVDPDGASRMLETGSLSARLDSINVQGDDDVSKISRSKVTEQGSSHLEVLPTTAQETDNKGLIIKHSGMNSVSVGRTSPDPDVNMETQLAKLVDEHTNIIQSKYSNDKDVSGISPDIPYTDGTVTQKSYSVIDGEDKHRTSDYVRSKVMERRTLGCHFPDASDKEYGTVKHKLALDKFSQLEQLLTPKDQPRDIDGATPVQQDAQSSPSHSPKLSGLTSHLWSHSGLLGSKDYQQSFISSKSMPAVYVHSRQSPVAECSDQLREETAIGRVLLDSLANESKLEEQLAHAEEEIRRLKRQITQLECDHARQAKKSEGTVEGLLLRIDEIMRSKQNKINERINECRAKDQVISKLTKTLQDAETAVNMLEQTLESTKRDLENERQHSAIRDTALMEIYASLSGDSSVGRGSVSLTPNTVTHRVRVLIADRDHHLAVLQKQLQESETMCQGLRKELESTTARLTAENKKRLFQLNEEHSKLMEAATERSMNAREQTLGLQAQLSAVEEHSRQELEAKSKQIADLLERLKAQTTETEAVKRLELEKERKSQEDLQKKDSALKASTSEVSQLEEQMTELKSELENMKVSLEAAETNLTIEREERSKVIKIKNKSKTDLKDCRERLEERTAEVSRLSEKISQEEEEHKRNLEAEVDLVRKQSEENLSKQQEDHKRKIDNFQTKLANSEHELKQAHSELKKSKERNSSHRNKIRELESKLEIIAKEKTDVVLILEGRDRDLVVLKHERDLLEGMLEKTKKESCLELRDKEAIQQSLNEIEPKYHQLLADNERLSSEMEQKDGQISELERAKQELLEVVEKTKTEWKKVKELKNNLGKKLHVREKRLKHLEEDLKQVQSSSAEKDSEVKKLHQENEGLKADFKELENKIARVYKERDVEHQQTSEQMAKAETEKALMGSQIKILQREIRTVRGTMRANQAVDDKAIEAAAGMKRDAALQKDLAESLQREVVWLEESLHETQKNCEKLLLERNHLQTSLGRAGKKIERFQKELKDMADKRKQQKGLVLKLEAALEKAALKYGESQQNNERQAQELARLRLHHQLELKELKGNLLKQLTTNFTMPKVQNLPQNFTNTPIEKVDKSSTAVDGTSPVPNPALEEDLKILLQGVLKSMILGEAADRKIQGKDLQKHSPPRESSTPAKRNPQKKLNRPHSKYQGQVDSYPLMKAEKHNNTDSRVATPLSDLPDEAKQFLTSPSSPVSTLLGLESSPPELTGEVVNDFDSARSNTPADTCGKDIISRGHIDDPSKDDAGADTNMKGIQDKLSRLAAMGSKLRDKNKEMELFLEDENS